MVRASILIKSNDQYNFLEQTFPRLARQTEKDFEVILIYSGRSEDSVELAKKWGARIVKIEPEDFSHPFALNEGALQANGQFLVILSADAVPAGETWLESLLRPLEQPAVAGVYGRQIPRPGDTPSALDWLRMRLRYGTNGRLQETGDSHIFSNANSALRRCLWQEHQFDERLCEVEDYEWAKWAQGSDYIIVYEPEAVVEHTHGDQYSRKAFWARAVRFTFLRWEIDDHRLTLVNLAKAFTGWRGYDTSNLKHTRMGTIESKQDPSGTLPDQDMPGAREEETDPTPRVHGYERPPFIVPLEISLTLDQIPDNEPCEFCEDLASKTLVEYELTYLQGGQPAIAIGEVPGYRCDACDLEFYDLRASVEVLDAAREIVSASNDKETLKRLEGSLKAGKRVLAILN